MGRLDLRDPVRDEDVHQPSPTKPENGNDANLKALRRENG